MNRILSVCLFSGGLDSTTAALFCRRRGDSVYLLTANYGQVMQRELESAREAAKCIGAVAHRFIELRGFKEISKSARTDAQLIECVGTPEDTVPSAYPPGRDFTFIGLATAWAESLVLADPAAYDEARVVIGTNATDSLDYPDCKEHVYERFSILLQASLKMTQVLGKRICVEAPLMRLTKAAVVTLGLELGVPFDQTWSCYQGGTDACGTCDACRIRYHAFLANGQRDPVAYRVNPTPLTRHHNERVEILRT